MSLLKWILPLIIVAPIAWVASPSRGCNECPFYNGAELTKALLEEADKNSPSGIINVEEFFKNTTYIMYSYVPGVQYPDFFKEFRRCMMKAMARLTASGTSP